MATFKFVVNETQIVERLYHVDADTLEQATEKAESGDTSSEETLRIVGVINREIVA